MIRRVHRLTGQTPQPPAQEDAQTAAAMDALLDKMARLHRNVPDEEIEADVVEALREQ
jgi:hypothetical protein